MTVRKGLWQIVALGLMLSLGGCADAQKYLDQQDQALSGLLPISATTIRTWTMGSSDVFLERTYLSNEYRLTSKSFRENIKLTLNNIEDIQRFDLTRQTALVFYGTYGAEKRKGYEIFSFNERIVQTLIPAGNKKYVFKSSVDRQNLIGAETPFPSGHSLFLAKPERHEWPARLENLASEDREVLFPSPRPDPGPDQKTFIRPSQTASVKHPASTYKRERSASPTLIRTSVLTTLPEAVEKPQTNNEQKPVLRID